MILKILFIFFSFYDKYNDMQLLYTSNKIKRIFRLFSSDKSRVELDAATVAMFNTQKEATLKYNTLHLIA